MTPRTLSQLITSADTVNALDIRELRLLSMAKVVERTTYSRPSIYRLIAQGRFPAPLKLGGTKIAFREEEIINWVNNRPRALSPSDKDR